MKTQSIIILKNTITGEERRLLNGGNYRAPWKLDRVETVKVPGEPGEPITDQILETRARIAVWTQKLGMPIAEFFDAARWLLKKDCPFCQMGTQVLKAIDELGEHRAEKILAEILQAKRDNDHARLKRIKETLWLSERTTSQT